MRKGYAKDQKKAKVKRQKAQMAFTFHVTG